MPASSTLIVRIYGFLVAALIGVGAVWILAAELTRPAVAFFPTEKDSAGSAAKAGRASTAASLGWPRGDLAVDYAMLVGPDYLRDFRLGTARKSAEVERAATNAAVLAPYDARAWALLAAANAQAGWNNEKTLEQLKLSFYTAPNDIALIPLRIQIATRAASTSDEQLQFLLETDIRNILRGVPDSRAVLVAAYQAASQTGRRLIETKVEQFDPSIAAEVRAIRP